MGRLVEFDLANGEGIPAEVAQSNAAPTRLGDDDG
jgi:hypothetical protein